MDAMHATLQNIATLLTGIAQVHLQAQESPITQSQLAAEVSAPSMTPPLSLITPPLPPIAVETRSEMALENVQGGHDAISEANAASAQSTAVDTRTSKRPGIVEGLGKLFYLRS
jgi:hypothetical protein